MNRYINSPMGPVPATPYDIHKMHQKRVEKAGAWPLWIILFGLFILLLG